MLDKCNVIGTIIDEKFSICGFDIQAENGFILHCELSGLAKRKFENSQLKITETGIIEKGNFKLNTIETVFKEGNEYHNLGIIELSIISAIIDSNGNTAGFKVELSNGKVMTLRCKDIEKLSKIFKPRNFMIKHKSNGEVYMSALKGSTTKSLPKIEYGVKKENASVMNKDISIIDIFDFVSKLNGVIINQPGNYKVSGDTVEKINSNFKSLGIGEIAYPYLEFNEKKFSLSCGFRIPGYVEYKGSKLNTFVYRSKSIYNNGEIRLNNIQILVDNQYKGEVEQFLGSRTNLISMPGHTLDLLSKLTGIDNVIVFEIHTKDFDMLSINDKNILSDDALINNTTRLGLAKIANKYIRGAIKQLNEMGIYSTPKNKSIVKQLSHYSKEEIMEIIELGVDPYSGAFVEPGDKYSVGSTKDEVPEIEYIADGLDASKFTYAKMASNLESCPTIVGEISNQLYEIEDFSERAKFLASLLDKFDKVEKETKRNLWLHKTNYWLQNKSKYDDKNTWEPVSLSKKATYKMYRAKNINGLNLKLYNIDI